MPTNNRGANPSQLTKLKLCAYAAGRCQFPGCNKNLFKETLTWKDFNNSNIAHIVASSPDGPRGDINRSHLLSDKLENLMLLCPEHHNLIDKHPDIYSESVLLEMKQVHEKAIAEHCELIYKQRTVIIRLISPIKGKTPANISYHDAVEAVVPEKCLMSMHSYQIMVSGAAEYRSKEFWNEVERKLEAEFNCIIRGYIQLLNQDAHFSVFAIAPIPLIIKFGYLMGDKIPADIYQKSRKPDTWKWISDELTNKFIIKKEVIGSGKRIALVLSLTADISLNRVKDVYMADVVFTISAKHFGVNCISSNLDLIAFWSKYQETCDEIKNTYADINEIAVFPAIPISAAFEVGRRYMPGVYPKLKIYDDDNGFFETLTIGE